MNNRDPFNLRRSPRPAVNLLQTRAAGLGDRIAESTTRLAESGRKAIAEVAAEATTNMSAYAPHYQDGPTHRHPDVWQSSQSRYTSESYTHTNGISEKVTGFFGADRKDGLPMYKDKPYAYPGRRKKLPWYKQMRTVAIVLTSMAAISWWFGILSPSSLLTSDGKAVQSKDASKPSWFGSTFTSKGWEARAQEVKEVFKISFDGYEKYAWGTSRLWLPTWYAQWLY